MPNMPSSSSTQQTHEDVVAAGLSKTDQNIDNTEEDLRHAARGHRANLSNPSKFFLQIVFCFATKWVKRF